MNLYQQASSFLLCCSAVTDFEKRLPQLQQALEKAKKDHENAASAEASISEQVSY